jgi:hypothetical protein
VTTLPEAPQHRRWREARTAATERIAGFRCDLRSALDEAISHYGNDVFWLIVILLFAGVSIVTSLLSRLWRRWRTKGRLD